MQTCMLGYEQAKTVTEIASWANELVGKAVPGYPDYRVVKVMQFQLVRTQTGYDAALLVDVTEWLNEDSEVSLRESDVKVIEQLTSTILEPSESQPLGN
ncbi:MAG TPA: hypothetical protein VFQ36_16950 [Ktedonobacteraceae bacterium]|nr:hypothetical protein [Ktedonobacteraceae bacterium]